MENTATAREAPKSSARFWILLPAAAGLAAFLLWPGRSVSTAHYVLTSMIAVSPLVIPGILLSAWVNASGAGGRVAAAMNANRSKSVLLASAVGAVTPVCGVAVLPLMAGLLSSGVPLAPVMAFWLSSPVTDPAMFAVTAATLGPWFAVGKSLAAFAIGLMGGIAAATVSNRTWARAPLRSGGLAATLCASSCCTPEGFNLAIWKSGERRRAFLVDFNATMRLVVACLTLAFAAEHLLHQWLEPDALAGYVGSGKWWAIPSAVLVGAPAYLDGYAALPLTRALVDHGMSPGAAMAFLVSGGVVSIWGALAIFPILKPKPFILYLGIAVFGSMAVGWLYEWVS